MAEDSRDSGKSLPKNDNSDSDTPDTNPQNMFVNDGSFMEMFKRQMEAKQLKEKEPNADVLLDSSKKQSKEKQSERDSSSDSNSNTEDSGSNATDSTAKSNIPSSSDSSSTAKKKPSVLSFVGKRRNKAPVLKTGALAKKPKVDSGDGSEKKDAWARYMAEVKSYKDRSCQDEDKTRPLVK